MSALILLSICYPTCGSFLVKRTGKKGSFLDWSQYPKCIYTFNLSSDTPVICPICGSPLTVRKDPYGIFFGTYKLSSL
ncbi:MAG: hypothetical protein EU548_04900 [Promethearchaeota archaeon]|nr:MAG: hypothetical protein EU548_04900 [Candidatus Lokiarchaeota archaeon]